MRRLGFLAALVLFAAGAAHAAAALTIVKAGPVGEVATLAEANEIRIVFSEPMVAAGKVPKNLVVPWFHLDPAVAGTFRWSGTTTLIFTPAAPLPFATKFDVRIDPAAQALSGKTLGKPYTFSFITPTIQLRRTIAYRKNHNAADPVIIILQFNQPVDPKNIVEHLQLRTRAHDLTIGEIPSAGAERLRRIEPAALAAFDAKKAKALAAAGTAGQKILAFLTDEWDRKNYPPKDDMVVLETKPGVPPGTSIQVYIDSELARGAKNVRTGRVQEFTIELPPMLFVTKLNCVAECDPDAYDALEFTSAVSVSELLRAISVTDVTDPAHEVRLQPKARENTYDPHSRWYSFDELGYTIEPAHRYTVRIDPSLKSDDGQTLDYTWMAVADFWHRRAFTSFGDGHGVWETSGGPVLPFHARNFRSVTQWMAPVAPEQLVPAIVSLQEGGFQSPPQTPARERKLAPQPDAIQSYGLDVTPALQGGKGLVWVAVREGEPIERTRSYADRPLTRASLVQVTNLGISVKDSPQNTLVFVTRLDDGAPVAGANVSIRRKDNSVFWSGVTGADGLALAPRTDLRVEKKSGKGGEAEEEGDWAALEGVHFVVFAEKDGDVAYCVSDWHEGISPWEFDVPFDLDQRNPLLRGTIFTDRGVYKPGEETHAKIILRSDTPGGMQLLPAATKVTVTLRNSRDEIVDTRTAALSEWSSAEWSWRVPEDAPLGSYSYSATSEGQRYAATGSFLVAAYRRPEFRVDVSLGAPSTLAGTRLDGKITGRYLFGAPMSKLPVKWTYTKTPLDDVPPKVTSRFSADRYTFLGFNDAERNAVTISSKEQKLDTKGELHLKLDTQLDAGWPWAYRLEGDVTDVSRQHIAGRTSFRVDPAPWYIGVRTPSFFSEAAKGLDTEIIAVGLDGNAATGIPVVVEVRQIQWNSVRRAEGNGFYTWDTERKEIPAGSFNVTTAEAPVPLHIPLASGGQYQLIATAKDAAGHVTSTRVWFYALGAGYTAWERFDHNRIDLVPEKKTLRPGETARIMIKSPWERATALLTTEREGVRTWKQFELTSTQQTVSVPIGENDIPNVFVSVLLIKGRTREETNDESDPGKPSFRLGYTELKVEDASKRLRVEVKANREEFRPASTAKIEVGVTDSAGRGVKSEVTLWAVDYGVLSLTGYETPRVIESIYLEKALQVVTDDSREKIISRRVLTPKGGGEGGGGGRDAGAGVMRRDFRVLAFWLGSIVTDAKGRARTEVKLPESLTTYRIMAVAGDKLSRFGWAQNEIRVNKPLLLTPAFPRFLTPGDKASFGGVVHSQLARKGTATVTIRSLEGGVIEFTGETKKTVEIDANGSAELRFDAVAKAAGSARVQMTVAMLGESDAFEDAIPVRVIAAPETVAAYGSAGSDAASRREALAVPTGVIPGFGGLHLELSSTAMTGLATSAEYLVDYPYGCAEQRASAALALLLAGDLGEAFHLPGIDAAKAKAAARKSVDELPKFQCGDGGFSFWPGECDSTSPYLTSYVVHVLQRAKSMSYPVSDDVLKRGYDYLERQLAQKRPQNEGWWPAYTAWQAFTVKVLVEGGRNEDSSINRLLTYADRMPVFALSYLADALDARKEKGKRADELHRRIANAILPEEGSAHVEELADPYLLWFWNSNVRSTAIVLGTLVRHGEDPELVRRMVRWLMNVRRNGRWGNTQENAWAMESLVDYYRKYESEVPAFTGSVTLGETPLARETFEGRSAVARTKDLPMAELLRIASAGTEVPLVFTREGSGTLFYLMRLRYARNIVLHEPLEQGFTVERKYTPATFKAGDLVKVTLRVRNTKERRFVAVVDPIPAGTEPVESWFATTAADLAEQQEKADRGGDDWTSWWRLGGWDHVERHDDRVRLFATRLAEGWHEYTYMLRATTSGTFAAAPAHAEEMYEPEVFGRTATDVVEVKP